MRTPISDVNRKPTIESVALAAARRGFSLVEVLLVVSLLSLIVLVLMTVFNSTQAAFRAGVTQTDVLEGGRAAMDMLVADLKTMTASGYGTNYANSALNSGLAPGYGDFPSNSVNFYVNTNIYYPLVQSLPGSPGNEQRTNVLENVFLLSRQNISGHDTWVGVGYTVVATNLTPAYPLYRFVTNAPVATDPYALLNAFLTGINRMSFTNGIGWSHLIDGVVDLRVHAFDANGYQMTSSFSYQYNNAGLSTNYYPGVWFGTPQFGEAGFAFFSNTIPASVEVQLGTLEDHILQRAESLSLQPVAQSNYLSQEAGRTHVFRQRVLLPNVNPGVYP